MNSTVLTCAVLLALCFPLKAVENPGTAATPNILFTNVDNLGNDALAGSRNRALKRPRIDRLANKLTRCTAFAWSTRLARFHAAPRSRGGGDHGGTDELGYHALGDGHYVTDLHVTTCHLLGLDLRALEIPGRKRLEMDHGRIIREVLA